MSEVFRFHLEVTRICFIMSTFDDVVVRLMAITSLEDNMLLISGQWCAGGY